MLQSPNDRVRYIAEHSNAKTVIGSNLLFLERQKQQEQTLSAEDECSIQAIMDLRDNLTGDLFYFNKKIELLNFLCTKIISAFLIKFDSWNCYATMCA